MTSIVWTRNCSALEIFALNGAALKSASTRTMFARNSATLVRREAEWEAVRITFDEEADEPLVRAQRHPVERRLVGDLHVIDAGFGQYFSPLVTTWFNVSKTFQIQLA